jgi:hypothetical protein
MLTTDNNAAVVIDFIGEHLNKGRYDHSPRLEKVAGNCVFDKPNEKIMGP